MDLAELYDALQLPRDAEVGRRVPKSALVEGGALVAADRRAVEEGVERVSWRATLSPRTTGVAALQDELRDYAQIVVLTAELRLATKAARLPEVLHRALAHPVLLLTEAADGVSLSVGLKRRHEREAGRSVLERLVASPPLPPVDADDSGVTRAFLAALPLAVQPGGDLWSVHEGWAGRCEALAAARVTGRFVPPADAQAASGVRAALDAYESQAREAARLRKAASAERRLNVRIELADAATRAAAEAERLRQLLP